MGHHKPTKYPLRMRLVASTAELAIDGKARADRPLLLVDGVLEPLPSMYLAQNAGRSERTAWTYGRALVAWWKLLLKLKIGWDEVSVSDLRAFVMERSRNTARLQMTAVAGFYSWAYEAGWMDFRPFQVAGARRGWAPELTPGCPTARLPRLSRRQPKTTNRREFDAILAASSRRDNGLLIRDELTAECGRYMALRRRGVRGLTVSRFQFESLDSQVFVIDLDPRFTKGGGECSVLAPRQLVHKVRKYIEVYRSKIVEERKKRDPSYVEPDAVFLTNRGTPMSESYISTTWQRAARRAGLNRRFHSNRHFHATGLASGALRFGLRPYRLVKSQLGHKSEASGRAYVHIAEMDREILARAHAVNDFYEREHKP